jgi:hypothetical protein
MQGGATRLAVLQEYYPQTITDSSPAALSVERPTPELLVQYAQLTGKNGVLDFNGRSQALRVGPEISVYLFPAVETRPIFFQGLMQI